jgi:cytochrome b561
MKSSVRDFSLPSRILHWAMAVLILAMLFIVIGMVATVSSRYLALLSLHKAIGIGILLLALIRVCNRLLSRPPVLPQSMPRLQRVAAKTSHVVLYGLMLAMPLIGWGMLSAGGYPVVLAGAVQLPPILPHSAHLYAFLRETHTVGAFLLLAVLLLHIAAALYHGMIRRDGVLASMTTGTAR